MAQVSKCTLNLPAVGADGCRQEIVISALLGLNPRRVILVAGAPGRIQPLEGLIRQRLILWSHALDTCAMPPKIQ